MQRCRQEEAHALGGGGEAAQYPLGRYRRTVMGGQWGVSVGAASRVGGRGGTRLFWSDGGA